MPHSILPHYPHNNSARGKEPALCSRSEGRSKSRGRASVLARSWVWYLQPHPSDPGASSRWWSHSRWDRSMAGFQGRLPAMENNRQYVCRAVERSHSLTLEWSYSRKYSLRAQPVRQKNPGSTKRMKVAFYGKNNIKELGIYRDYTTLWRNLRKAWNKILNKTISEHNIRYTHGCSGWCNYAFFKEKNFFSK